MLEKEKITSLLVTIILVFITHQLIQSNNFFVENNVDKLSKEVLDSQSTILEHTISRNTKSAIILGQHIKLINGDMSRFEEFANTLLVELKGISNLQLAPNGIVKKIYPLKGNEKAIGHDLFNDDKRKKEAFLAKRSHELTLAGPFKLIQGGIGIVARKPIFIKNEFWGFTSALITIEDLIKYTNLKDLKQKEYIYRIKRVHPDRKKMDIFYGEKNFDIDKKIFTQQIIVPNGKWYLDIQYIGSYISNSFIFLLYLVGIIISLLLGYLFFIILNKPKELKETNELLENKVKKQTLNIQNNLNLIGKYVLYSKTDLEGNITDVSDAFCKLSGYSKKELIGNSHNILRDPNTASKFYKNMWDSLKKKKIWTGEFKNIAKSGHSFWINSIITPEFDNDGNHIGYIAIRYDVTARKSFEEQQLEKFHTSKMIAMGEMMGNIAHQWRQPLSAISSLASGINLQKQMKLIDDEELYEKLDNIVENTKYLSKTIDTFRNFLKVQNEKEETIIQERIEASILILKATLKEKNINLIKNFNKENSIVINIIPGHLEQVILNILNNAKDALVEKKVVSPWIKIDLKKLDEKVIILLEDNAGGIPDDVMPHIYEPYFTTKHQALGTGLGLNMSYRIVNEGLRGSIYVNNTENGAKFYIELPLN